MGNSDVIAICAGIISFLAFSVAVLTLFHDRRQRKLESLIKIYEFLHQDDLSKARRSVRESPIPPNLKDESFRRICSSFDFAATLIRHGAIDKKMFLDYWTIPLLALEAHMTSIANESTGVVSMKLYYRDFYWLIRESNNKYERNHDSRGT